MPRFSLVPAAYVYLRDGDRVLLQLRQNTGYMDGTWAAAAAGHIEPGETAIHAAVREASEELGVRITPTALDISSVMQRTDGTDDPIEQRVEWFFSCRNWEGEPTILEARKAAEIRWFALDDLPAEISAYERQALTWLRDHDDVGTLFHGFAEG